METFHTYYTTYEVLKFLICSTWPYRQSTARVIAVENDCGHILKGGPLATRKGKTGEKGKKRGRVYVKGDSNTPINHE